MAPLVRLAIQFLLGSSRFNTPCLQDVEDKSVASVDSSLNSLSTISWGPNRVDAFGSAPDGSVVHRFWDGFQWRPSNGLENHGGWHFTSPPTALSWGPNRIDIFNVGEGQSIYHKYWDGTAWKPDYDIWENLGGNLTSTFALAGITWGENRLNVFGVGPDGEGKNALWHKYWDGASWNPSGGNLDHLGGDFLSEPAAVSWGPGRIDVFAVARNGDLQHRYWNGRIWVEWETLGEGFERTPTAVSWGEDRLDIFAVGSGSGSLYHKFWDGYQWNGWENLGGRFYGSVSVKSWSANRFDLVGQGLDKAYWYTYWDGTQWVPSVVNWDSKSGGFDSAPSLASWGENRLDIFGVGTDQGLYHQTWYGSGWYPAADSFEKLGEPVKSFGTSRQSIINPGAMA